MDLFNVNKHKKNHLLIHNITFDTIHQSRACTTTPSLPLRSTNTIHSLTHHQPAPTNTTLPSSHLLSTTLVTLGRQARVTLTVSRLQRHSLLALLQGDVGSTGHQRHRRHNIAAHKCGRGYDLASNDCRRYYCSCCQ